MSTMSWLSRLVLGRQAVAAKQTAQETFDKALNGHKFEPEHMRLRLQQILITVERKAQALSVPPPSTGDEIERSSGHEPEDREQEAGACGGASQPCGANG
jgi:hypothetical protein